MDNDLHPDELRTLLQAVEHDTTRTSPNRESIRRSVMAAFDDASASPTSDEFEVSPLVTLASGPERTISSTRVMGWLAAAAAVLVALIGLSQLPGQVETTGPMTQGPSGQRRLSVSGPGPAADLEPGQQTTDVIAQSLSFDAPAGLIVLEERDGLLVLAAAEEPGGQLVIFETEPSDWERELAELGDADQVNLEQLGVTVDGRVTTRWDVTITNQAITARSCTVGEPCIRLADWPTTGPAAIWAGADNRIVELGRSENTLVLAIETSQRFTGPLSPLAAQVINSATLNVD